MTDELNILIKNSDNLNNLCRICLAESPPEAIPLFSGRDLAEAPPCERVMLCTKVKLERDPSLPGLICAPCARELDAADGFRLKCEHSDALLRKFFVECILKNEKEEKELCQDSSDLWNAIKDEDAKLEGIEGASEKVVRVKKSKRSKSKKNHPFDYEIPIKEELENDSDDNHLSDSIPEEQNTGKLSAKERKNSGKFPCHICGKPLTSKFAIEQHVMRMHSGGKQRPPNVTGFGAARRFHCTECPYSTPYGQSLKYHLRVHSGEKPYRCPECSRCFSQPGRLSSHRKTHSDKTYFTCAQCGRQFKHKDTYEAHKKVHRERGEFECGRCGKALKSKETLEAHMNRHDNIRNHSCETCGATFVTRTELINHSRNHNTEKNFQCNYCDFRTHTKKILDPHLRRHSGERPFKCAGCSMACFTAIELKYHMRKHSKDKLYACPQCQIRFKYSSSVNRHMLKAHDTKFRRSDTLDRRLIK